MTTPSEVEAVARARCPVCLGNDYDVPCAYPSGGTAGCLRDIRLDEERERNAWAAEFRAALDQARRG